MACVLCASKQGPVCEACESKLNWRPRNVCRNGLFGIAAIDYEPVTSSLITSFKEHGLTTLKHGFAGAMVNASCALDFKIARTDVLVPVPSHPESKRGFSPAAELAGALAPRLGMAWFDALRLRNAVSDQAGLGQAMRRRNLIGAMTAKAWLGQRNVILVDDLVTTGATLTEASRALAEIGCRTIGFMTFAETLKKTDTR